VPDDTLDKTLPLITLVLYCLSQAVREELDHFTSWHTRSVPQIHFI
jgi:hypothetical protein